MHAVGTGNPIPSYLQSLLDTDNHAGPNALPASFRDSIGKAVAQKPALPCSPEHMHGPKHGSRADRALWSLPQGSAEKASIPRNPGLYVPSWTHGRHLKPGL